MNSRGFHTIFFIGMFVFAILAMFWQYTMYQECRSDGYKAYVCMAMMQKGHYIWVDMMDGGN